MASHAASRFWFMEKIVQAIRFEPSNENKRPASPETRVPASVD